MRQEEHSHLLQSILDEMVSGGSPGRGNWERAGAALCTEAHRHIQPQGLSPSSPGPGFDKSLWEMHSSLPRAALATVTCLGKHLAPQGSSGSVHVTFPAARAGTSIPGHPGVLVASTSHLHCSCPSCNARRASSPWDMAAQTQGWSLPSRF